MQRALSHGLAAAILVTAVGLGGCKPKESAAQDPLTTNRLVVAATVEPSGAAAGRYTGLVGARIESDLGFRVQGKVIERLVDTGQLVKKGQPLMKIDPTDYSHALVAQSGNVAAARAKWIQADADEKRSRGLVSSGAVSQSAYDQLKAAADGAKALLDAATAQEQEARNQQDYSILLADADGTVKETLAEPGQVVTAGQIVVRLAHAGPREAVVNLPETIRPEIGAPAMATLYGGDVQVAARLRQLSDSADPRTRTFEARYVMEGTGASAPLGATVTIALGGNGQADLLSVPLGAIDDEGHGPGVWVVDLQSSKVSFRPVGVQALGGESAEISKGLSVGETIVATGGHYLHDGEQIRLAKIQAAMQ